MHAIQCNLMHYNTMQCDAGAREKQGKLQRMRSHEKNHPANAGQFKTTTNGHPFYHIVNHTHGKYTQLKKTVRQSRISREHLMVAWV